MVDPSLNGNHPMSVIRPLTQDMMMKPWLSFIETDLSFTNWKNKYRTQVNALAYIFLVYITECNCGDKFGIEIGTESESTTKCPHFNF